MIPSNLIYYARMEYNRTSKRTPKYVIVAEAGVYPPMEQLRGGDGRISMFLMKRQIAGGNVPPMWLQAKDSLNFTGLKGYFERGRLSGFAYGYPNTAKTYGKDKKPNPFAGNKADAFLFVIHKDGQAVTEAGQVCPGCMELIVIKDGQRSVYAHAGRLKSGDYDEALATLREQAKQTVSL